MPLPTQTSKRLTFSLNTIWTKHKNSTCIILEKQKRGLLISLYILRKGALFAKDQEITIACQERAALIMAEADDLQQQRVNE